MPRRKEQMAKLETADLIKGIKAALNDDGILSLLKSIIAEPLVKEMESLRSSISQKNETIDELKHQVGVLEQRCDDLEQYSRRNRLRLHGVPERKDENLLDEIPQLLNKELQLDPPLDSSEICRLHRLGPKSSNNGKPRSIIIKLVSYQSRRKIYASRTKLRHSSMPLFLNEDLTKRRARLFWKARQLKKKRNIADAWSFDGNVFIKDNEGKIIHIRDETHLDTFCIN